MTRADTRWLVLADAPAVAREAARRIGEAGARAIAGRGGFRLVLAGGRTPVAAYRRLAEARHDWARWQFYFGDERCLPADHPERNSRMADEALFQGLALDLTQIHPIPAEQGAAAAAQAYATVVREAEPFDLVVLGLGEDGHTASLFPGRLLDPDAWTVAVADAPKPPPERVSLGLRALRGSRERLVLATGAGKQWAVSQWQAGADLPIARVCRGRPVTVLLDAAAAGQDNPG